MTPQRCWKELCAKSTRIMFPMVILSTAWFKFLDSNITLSTKFLSSVCLGIALLNSLPPSKGYNSTAKGSPVLALTKEERSTGFTLIVSCPYIEFEMSL